MRQAAVLCTQQDETHPLSHQQCQENNDLIYAVTAAIEAGSRSQQKK